MRARSRLRMYRSRPEPRRCVPKPQPSAWPQPQRLFPGHRAPPDTRRASSCVPVPKYVHRDSSHNPPIRHPGPMTARTLQRHVVCGHLVTDRPGSQQPCDAVAVQRQDRSVVLRRGWRKREPTERDVARQSPSTTSMSCVQMDVVRLGQHAGGPCVVSRMAVPASSARYLAIPLADVMSGDEHDGGVGWTGSRPAGAQREGERTSDCQAESTGRARSVVHGFTECTGLTRRGCRGGTGSRVLGKHLGRRCR